MDTAKTLSFPRIMYKLADDKTDRRKSLVKWRGVEYETLSCASSADVKPGFKTLEAMTTKQVVEVEEVDDNPQFYRKPGRPRK